MTKTLFLVLNYRTVMIEMAAGLQFSFPKPNQLAAAANFSRIYLRKCKNEVEYKFSSIVLIGDTNGKK